MLDDFIEEQPIVYKILINSLKKNKLSHAYLFELNDYTKGYNIALAFAKFLLCPHNYSNNNLCDGCTICKTIDDNNYIELKIIEPDGQWIKKEQLDDLQKEFITKSLVGNKKIYIIKEADKLNVSSSNSLLKFLEEPPENVYAILLTNNMYQLLNTIISRCQVISFKKNKNKLDDNSIKLIANYLYSDINAAKEFVDNFGFKYIDTIIEYVYCLENNKENTIALKNREFLDIFNDRNKLFIAFELFVLYYRDVLNYLLKINCTYYNDYLDNIKSISKNNSIDKISKKIKIIVKLSEKIKYNLNSNLLLDKLVILLSEV